MSLLDTDVEKLRAGTDYEFTVTKFDKLLALEYTLVTLLIDTSTSVSSFKTELESCLKEVLGACKSHPRKNNLLLRVVDFNSKVNEIHGFRLIKEINDDDYTNVLNVGGMTSLYEGMDNSVEATGAYGADLAGKNYICNGALYVVTDGENNWGSITDPSVIKRKLDRIRKEEKLAQFVTVLVGVTNDNNNLSSYLQMVKDEVGMDQYLSIGQATAKSLAKLGKFISASISSTSTALGTGTLSQPIDPSTVGF